MVIARETTLQELLEGSRQYKVPLYQRTYSWGPKQLDRLWGDVEKLAEDRAVKPGTTYFIGSLVLAPSPSIGPAGVQEFLVVDGQQRLTTLSLLLCALRDHRAEHEGAEHRERLDEQYLINKWRQAHERPKLVPTQADRAAYLACLESTPQGGGSDPIGAAYRHFRSRLTAASPRDVPQALEQVEDAVIRGLSVVSVTAETGDNAYRIFESLNNTGMPLKQGDLLRNYLFMRLPTRGEVVYESLWLPLQKSLTSDQLEQLFWLDLVREDPRVKQTDVYDVQQARLAKLTSEAEIEAEIKRFARLGDLLQVILQPVREAHPGVRLRLERLQAWGTSVVSPLLLHLLDLRAGGKASSEQVAKAMLYVESFLVRRLLIGRATANINRIMLAVVTEMRHDRPVDQAVHLYLSTGRRYYAPDKDIADALRAVPYYLNGRPHQRALVLRWLEQSFDNREPVDLTGLTIEHVLPQTPGPAWLEVLTEDVVDDETAEEVHEELVHTLGNLTLTGYNSELSNSPFPVKRDKLQTSGLRMNQELATEQRWGRPEILRRADRLARRVAEVWPAPVTGGQGDTGPAWDLLEAVLAQIPAGTWTSYLDLAALIGSHQVPVGHRLATHPAPNAHRVLKGAGVVSPQFRWLDPARTDDPRDLLRAEGVRFSDSARADQEQRLRPEQLARLVGLDPTAVPDQVHDLDEGDDPQRRDRFIQQLHDSQEQATATAVLAVLDAWSALGGRLTWGSAAETSCFLIADDRSLAEGGVCPAFLYPSGKFEVVFQHLAQRGPFQDSGLREEFRRRLNAVPGVALPADKLEGRPGFVLSLLQPEDARDALVEALDWFRRTALQRTAEVAS